MHSMYIIHNTNLSCEILCQGIDQIASIPCYYAVRYHSHQIVPSRFNVRCIMNSACILFTLRNSKQPSYDVYTPSLCLAWHITNAPQSLMSAERLLYAACGKTPYSVSTASMKYSLEEKSGNTRVCSLKPVPP